MNNHRALGNLQACPQCGAVRYKDGEHLDTNQAGCDSTVAAHYNTVPVYGWSRKQLSDAFDLVKDRTDWKYPVNALMPATVDTNLIGDAIIFFTGSEPMFTREGHKIRVRAAGYYDAIGS